VKVRLNQKRGRLAAATALLLFLLNLAVPGMAAPWVQTTSLPDAYIAQTLVYASNYLYQAGGSSDSYGFDDGTNVFYSLVHSDGTIAAWTKTTSLPVAVIDPASVAANGFVYVLAGEDFFPDNSPQGGVVIPTNTVYYAKINSDGSLGSWSSASPLPNNLTGLGASVWNKQIYVIGGSLATTLSSNVYSATIQADGSLSAWTTQAPLPVAINTTAEAANGFLYVLGGYINNGNTIVNTVYYSKINSDGTLAGWNLTTSLPQPESYFGAVAANGFIFSIGGFNGTSPTSSFYISAVKGDGSLGSWLSGTSLPLPIYFHAVAASGSYIFFSGGTSISQDSSAVYSMALPAPLLVPTLAAGGFTNGNFQLQLASSTNTGFGLLASPDLINWTNLGWGFTDTNGTLLFQDTNAASFPNRFYRAYWPLP
jgi:hypothetical protein